MTSAINSNIPMVVCKESDTPEREWMTLVRATTPSNHHPSPPPVESLFAAPNFHDKLSQCDLEKPLHRFEKLPALQPHQNHHVTPSTVSKDQVESSTVDEIPATLQIIALPPRNKESSCDFIINPHQPELDKPFNPHTSQTQQEEETEALIRFDSPCQIGPVTTTEKIHRSTEPFRISGRVTNLAQKSEGHCQQCPLSQESRTVKEFVNKSKCGTSRRESLESFNQFDIYTQPCSMYPPLLLSPELIQGPEMLTPKEATKDKDDFMPPSRGENRMNRLRRPQLVSQRKPVEDSVSVWEGSHYYSSEREDFLNDNLPLIDIENQEPLPSRPPTRRHFDQEEDNLPQEEQLQVFLDKPVKQKRRPKIREKKFTNLISNVCRLHQLQKEKETDSQENSSPGRPKTCPATASSPTGQFQIGKPVNQLRSKPTSVKNHRPSTCIPMIPFSDKSGKIKGAPSVTDCKQNKRSTKAVSVAPPTNLRPVTAKRPLSVNRSFTAGTDLSKMERQKPGTATSINTEKSRPGHGRANQCSQPESGYLADDETGMELISSSKSKTLRKRKAKSPMSLYSPLVTNKGNKVRSTTPNNLQPGAVSRKSTLRVKRRKFVSSDHESHLSNQNLAGSSNIQSRAVTPGKRLSQTKHPLRKLSERFDLRTKLPRIYSNSPKSRIPKFQVEKSGIREGNSPKVEIRMAGKQSNKMGVKVRTSKQKIRLHSNVTTYAAVGSPRIYRKGSCDPICSLPNSTNSDSKVPDAHKKRELREKLERMEHMRERHRAKDFERHKRDKGWGQRDDHPGVSTTSMLLPNYPKYGGDKMVHIKIIVRRKNPDGSLPAIENVIGSFTTKWTYLILDEQPLTHSSPNPYLIAHKTKPRAKTNTNTYYSLKITTSDQSTIDSLPSEEAFNRFLTCYVCGKSVNVRDYPEHERDCIRENREKNELLDPIDQRILPPKPQGTITIQHWNQFAYDSLRDRYVKCPYCGLEYFPDRLEDLALHEDRCTDRIMKISPNVGVRDIDPNYGQTSVQEADESMGFLVPSSKLLSRGHWSRAAARTESYTRPIPRRYRPFRKSRPMNSTRNSKP